MFRLLQRLLLPVFVLALLIGVLNIKDEFGFDPIDEVEIDDSSSELLTPVFSLRRAPNLLVSPLANQKLNDDLLSLSNMLPTSSCLAVSSNSEELFDYQVDIPLISGNAQKLITAYAGIQQIGVNYQYETLIGVVREPESDGLLRTSDLYIFGSGDPLLRTDAYAALLPENYSTIRTSADELADLTVGMNILFIQGAVVVDESRYDEVRTVPGWSSELKDSAAIGSLSAALLDGGYEGLKQGYSSQVGVDNPPPLLRSPDPVKRFAANFDDLLEARNVVILKAAKEFSDTDLEDLIEMVSIKSPTFDLIIKQMLTNNDSITAEMILKEIGFSRSGQGTTGAGLVALPEILAVENITNSGMLLIDGSGLSPENQVTCKVLNSVLKNESTKDVFKNALPLAGVEGVVADQFIGTAFEGNLNAAFSQEENHMSFAGYFTTETGTEITITFISNPENESETADKDFSEVLALLSDAISEYTGGQPLDGLGPLLATEE